MPFNFPIAENHAGEYLAQGIREAFAQIAEGRRRRKLDQERDADKAEQRSIFEAGHPGFHFAKSGLDVPQDVWGNIASDVSSKVPSPQLDLDPVAGKFAPSARAAGAPMAQPSLPGSRNPAPSESGRGVALSGAPSNFASLFDKALGPQTPQGPRYEFQKGYYIDHAQEDAARDRAANASGHSLFQRMMMHVLENQITPHPQQHVTDPGTGDVTFFDPRNPPSDLQVSPRPTPGGHYDANRGVIVNADGSFTPVPGLPPRHSLRSDSGVQQRTGLRAVEQQIRDTREDIKRTTPKPLGILASSADSAAFRQKTGQLPNLRQRAESLSTVRDRLARDVQGNRPPAPQPQPTAQRDTVQTQDEYDHLVKNLGWSDAQVQQRYDIAPGVRRSR